MDLMCPKHNERLIPRVKPLRMPAVPANAQDTTAYLEQADCVQCGNWYWYTCDSDGRPFLEETPAGWICL